MIGSAAIEFAERSYQDSSEGEGPPRSLNRFSRGSEESSGSGYGISFGDRVCISVQ
jgi:hypothetical protein